MKLWPCHLRCAVILLADRRICLRLQQGAVIHLLPLETQQSLKLAGALIDAARRALGEAPAAAEEKHA